MKKMKPNQDSTPYRYDAVIHMPDAEAARPLGKTVQVVRAYRAAHPEFAYRPAPAPVKRAGIVTLEMPLLEASRSVSGRDGVFMPVSLPAPPLGLNISFGNREVRI
jgi:hypothetical protein